MFKEWQSNVQRLIKYFEVNLLCRLGLKTIRVKNLKPTDKLFYTKSNNNTEKNNDQILK